VVLLALASVSPGQDPPRPQEPVIVTATRTGKDPFELPYSTTLLTGRDLTIRRQVRTTPEALRGIAGVSVQKTAHGQGSPKIRGQTGYLTLLLVDGIRINDSTWRSGNNEYWNHVDPLSIDRLELVRGPGSVLWGSDAVAGIGQAFQKERHSWESGLRVDTLASFRFASAEDSTIYRVENQGNVDRTFGWHLGVSYKDLGDLSAGRDVGRQPVSGYHEVDGDGKLTWRLDEQQQLQFGFQVADLDDVPRTHSTVFANTWRGLTTGSDRQRDIDYQRQLWWLRWSAESGTFFDSMETTLSWKNRDEREHRIRSNNRLGISVLEVETLGLTAQLSERAGSGTVTWGADWYHDFVESSFREFAPDGSLRTVRDRGVVAGDADYDLVGVFGQYDVPLGAGLELIAGARWTYARLDASRVDVPGDALVFDDIQDDWNAVTGNVRLLHATAEHVRLFGGVSQGFRAPNLADTTRFDAGRTGEVEVPVRGLDPEQYYNFEIGGRYDDGERIAAVTGYYTVVRDQIARFRTGNTIQGEAEVVKANVGDGWVAGFETEGALRLSAFDLEAWSVYGLFDYVDGRLDQIDATGGEIEDRPPALPPPSGEVGLRWEHPDGTAGVDVYTRMAYRVHASRYTESDRLNTSRIPPDGLPGYAVYGLRGWKDLGRNATASLAVENLTDVDYRIMDSGLMEPGTNVIVTLEARF
jgi:hemoglobin/transferrin/lactoferrin receptor protein